MTVALQHQPRSSKTNVNFSIYPTLREGLVSVLCLPNVDFMNVAEVLGHGRRQPRHEQTGDMVWGNSNLCIQFVIIIPIV